MFGLKIISKKLYNEANEELKSAAKVIDEQTAKINELTLKLYFQTLALKEVNAEREALIYNRRDNHGCLIRNKK
jgi:hypothetical protein